MLSKGKAAKSATSLMQKVLEKGPPYESKGHGESSINIFSQPFSASPASGISLFGEMAIMPPDIGTNYEPIQRLGM